MIRVYCLPVRQLQMLPLLISFEAPVACSFVISLQHKTIVLLRLQLVVPDTSVLSERCLEILCRSANTLPVNVTIYNFTLHVTLFVGDY